MNKSRHSVAGYSLVTYKYMSVLPENKWLLLGLLNSCTCTTQIREIHHLWEVFLTEKADFGKFNVLMLTILAITLKTKVTGRRVSETLLGLNWRYTYICMVCAT